MVKVTYIICCNSKHSVKQIVFLQHFQHKMRKLVTSMGARKWNKAKQNFLKIEVCCDEISCHC